MLNNLDLRLELINNENNHWRRYHLAVHQDLFGFIEVVINYGRIRTVGRTHRRLVANIEAAYDMVRDSLKRRLSAPQRLDAAYKIAHLAADDQATEILSPILDCFDWKESSSKAGQKAA